jgi:hypothetical protein
MINNLIEAYKNTKYKVFNPNLVIEIGVMNNDLNDILSKNNATEWAYITAFNPYSKVLTDSENKDRHLELQEVNKSFLTYEGHGVGTDPSWEPELSLLVIGISKSEAILIGKKFEQNAIVYGKIDNTPELLILV